MKILEQMKAALEAQAPLVDETKRQVDPKKWASAWQELADLTTGIPEGDYRFEPILRLLDGCDEAFEKGDWPLFVWKARAIKRLVAAGK